MKSSKSKSKSVMVKKAKPKMGSFSLTVVGLRYRLDKIEVSQLAKLVEEQEGMPVKFELEPDNQVDAKAVKVIAASNYIPFSGRFIGYIARPANATFFDLLRRGAEVKVALLTHVDMEAREGTLEVAVLRPSK